MPTEHQIQSDFFKIAEVLAKSSDWYSGLRYMFAIPNGGARNIVTATLLKREGVKKGVPDVFLPIPRGQNHGLFIEFKVPKGKQKPEQIEYAQFLTEHGYRYFVCFSANAAIETVKWYMNQDNDK